MDKTFLNNYKTFVDGITSPASKDINVFIERVKELDKQGVDVPRLLTVSVGLPAEAGEFSDIVKKIVFHHKEYSNDNKLLLRKELGDVMWYWMNSCIALDCDPYEIIEENVKKLESRYPGGFSIWNAENRSADDV